MSIRRHRAQSLLLRLEQQAVEVVPNVLLSHRKVRFLDQSPQIGYDLHAKFASRLISSIGRKIGRAQRRQREPTASAFHGQPLAA